MKIIYEIDHLCDGCLEIRKTRSMKGLDPRHKHIENWLCKKCDKSHETCSKIYKKNTRCYGYGDAFGLKEGNTKFVIIK